MLKLLKKNGSPSNLAKFDQRLDAANQNQNQNRLPVITGSNGTRPEPFNFTPMAVNPISSGSPHVRPMGRTCGEPDEIKKITHPKYITALFRAPSRYQQSLACEHGIGHDHLQQQRLARGPEDPVQAEPPQCAWKGRRITRWVGVLSLVF